MSDSNQDKRIELESTEDLRSETAQGNLKNQAEDLRKELRERQQRSGLRFPDWKKVLYFLVIVGAILGATALLIFEQPRQGLVRTVSSNWLGLVPDSSSEVFELPPPPPKPSEPKVSAEVSGVFTDQGFEGVLFADLDLDDVAGSSDEKDEQGPRFIPPEKTPDLDEAFEALKENSETVAALVEGNLEDYTFQEWNPVRIDRPRYLLDLLVIQNSTGNEVHMVWQVNLETGDVRAMSQAARDLRVR